MELANDHDNGCLLLAATMSIGSLGEISSNESRMLSWKQEEVTRKAGSRIFARGNRKVMGMLSLEC